MTGPLCRLCYYINDGAAIVRGECTHLTVPHSDQYDKGVRLRWNLHNTILAYASR